MSAIASAATHWCRIGDAYVFLDLRRDRYFMLEHDAGLRFASIVHSPLSPDDRSWLADRNLEKLAPPLPEAVTPKRSLLDDEVRGRVTLFDTAQAIFFLRRAQRDVRRISLANILSTFSLRGPASAQLQEHDAQKAAEAFRRARHYVSGIDECLSRGVAMRRYLAGKGCEARLVIGVTLPFAAHCWVQLGSAVLTDPLDVVTPYQPILAA